MKTSILLIAAVLTGEADAGWKTKSNLWSGASYTTSYTTYYSASYLTKYAFKESQMTSTDKKKGYINRIKMCFNTYNQLPWQTTIDYGLKNMCTNRVTKSSLKVGSANG